MQLRKENALDDELFEEFTAQAEKTKKFLDEAQTKLDATTLRWEKENTLKEARDIEDAKNEALRIFDERKQNRAGLMEVPKQEYEEAKGLLDENLAGIAQAEKVMSENDEGTAPYTQAQGEKAQLEAQTQGLRDTADGKYSKLVPFLIDQGRDDQYVSEGLEFTAYHNLELAKEAGETAQAAIDENKDEEKALKRELKDAEWALNNAKSQDEYVHAREVYDDVVGRSERLDAVLSEARKTMDELEGVVGDLQKEYDDAKDARKEYAKFLRDNNLEVEEYDPKEGPPREPEESITSQVMRLGTLQFYAADS